MNPPISPGLSVSNNCCAASAGEGDVSGQVDVGKYLPTGADGSNTNYFSEQAGNDGN